MFFILIGGLLVAVSAGALASLPYRLAKKPVPRGLMPIIGGISLLVFVLWNDYSWYSRTIAELPERVAVVETFTYSGALQPWTLIKPRINRFTAVDRASIQRNEALPGYVMADIIFVQRYQPTLQARQIFDCADTRRADLTDSTEFDERGMPQNVNLVDLEDDHPLIPIVCAEPAPIG